MSSSISTENTKPSRWKRRYLIWSFPILFLLFEAVNVRFVYLVSQPNAFSYARVTMSTRIRDNSQAVWISALPQGEDWPSLTETTIYRKFGIRAYVYEADGADASPTSPEQSYMITILQGGFPFAAGEYKRCTIWENESIIQAFPPTNKMPLRWKALGLVLNPLIFAVPTWLFLSVLPIGIMNRHTKRH